MPRPNQESEAPSGRPTQVIVAGSLLAVVGIFLAGVSGGFDFTDEGFYYLSFVHPENVADNQTSFFFFGGKVFALLGRSIVAMRIATLLTVAAAAWFLARSCWRFLEEFAPGLIDREHRRIGAGLAVLASLLGFAVSPAALSYNFQNTACLLGATGFLLRAAARPASPRLLEPGTLGALAGFGLLAGLDFFVKFSTSVPLAGLGGGFFFVVSRQSWRSKGALAGLLLAAFVAVGAAYFGLVQSFGPWWAGIKGTMEGIVQQGYAAAEVRRYAGEIGALALEILRNFVPVWVVAVPAALLVVLLRARRRASTLVAIAGGVWTLLHLIWLTGRLAYHEEPGTAFFLGSLLLLALFAGAGALAGRTAPDRPAGIWPLVAAAILLFLLPYLGAFGTNNEINRHCLYQLSPWFLVATLLLARLDLAWGSAWPGRITALLLAVVAGSQFYHGYWRHPYRVAGTREEQTIPTPLGHPPTSLRLPPAVHDFLATSRRVLDEHGFKPGDDLLALFNLPGLVFAMGGQSPGHVWYFQGSPRNYELNLMRLNFIPEERRRRAFIIRNSGEPDWGDFQPYLRQAGLNFPAGYRLISPPLTSPFTGVPFEIWQPIVAPAAR